MGVSRVASRGWRFPRKVPEQLSGDVGSKVGGDVHQADHDTGVVERRSDFLTITTGAQVARGPSEVKITGRQLRLADLDTAACIAGRQP